MRTLVLYKSKMGTTKKYAEEIASRLQADVMPLNKFKWKKVSEYQIVIFGGWVMGGKIQGVDDFLVHYDQMNELGINVIVFANGLGFANNETRAELISSNVLDLYHIRFYQFRGSFDFSKLGWFHKLALDFSMKRMEKDPNATADARYFSTIKDHPIEYYDEEKITKVVSVVNKIIASEAKA